MDNIVAHQHSVIHNDKVMSLEMFANGLKNKNCTLRFTDISVECSLGPGMYCSKMSAPLCSVTVSSIKSLLFLSCVLKKHGYMIYN